MHLHRVVGPTLAAMVVSGVAAAPALAMGPGPPLSPPLATRDLRITPTTGSPGSSIHAVATGFDDCFPVFDDVGLGQVVFHWAGRSEEWTSDIDEGGTAAADIIAPADLAPGSHQVVASCNETDDPGSVDQPFVVPTVDSPESLRLEPESGSPGGQVTATADGFQCDGEVRFLWNGDQQADSQPADPNGTATATIEVPFELAPGPHVLVARCSTDPAEISRAPFTVAEEPDEAEQLDLRPTAGPLGSRFTATATGYRCAGDVLFLWGAGDQPVARAVPDDLGTATVEILATGLRRGPQPLVARCEADAGEIARANFTVSADRQDLPEALELDPGSGAAGSQFTVTATGFECPGVGFRWADGRRAGNAPVISGAATAQVEVPGDFDRGTRSLVAECTSDGSQIARAAFTVTADSPEVLALTPTSGAADGTLTATAKGYECSRVVFSWDGRDIADSPPNDQGVATAQITIPEGSGSGDHDVVGLCADDAIQTASASYTVDRSWLAVLLTWLALGGGIGIALWTARKVVRHLWPKVQVMAGAAATRGPKVVGPDENAWPAIVVRIVPRDGPGASTIEEMNP